MTLPTLDVDGYTLLDGLLDPAALAGVRVAVQEALGRTGQHSPSGTLHADDLRGPAVDDLWHTLAPAVEELSGPDPQRGAMGLRAPYPGFGAQALHADFAGLPPLDGPRVAVAIVALVDVPEPGGATRVVPGTHRWQRLAPRDSIDRAHPDQRLLALAAGSAVRAASRSGSARMSRRWMRPSTIVNDMIDVTHRADADISPTVPFTSTARAVGAPRRNIMALPAICAAPRTSLDRPEAPTPPSTRSTASGSSSATSASKSPRPDAASQASTTCRCFARSRSGARASLRTRLRARLASCRVAAGLRPTIGAIASKGTANMSCRTSARRSAGSSDSSTTCSASPTASASIACSAGSSPVLTTGSGTCTSRGSSRRRVRERSMVRHWRATSVVSQPPRFLDAVDACAGHPQPGLLHGVLGLGVRAEHPVVRRAQVRAVLLEAVGEPGGVGHRSHPRVGRGHEGKHVHLRASQINGCGVCVDRHSRELRHLRESDERIFAVAAGRETPYFTDAERAALAHAEAATRLADRPDPVPDAVGDDAADHFDEKELAGLIISIAAMNAWNRINATTRRIAGAAWAG